MQCLKTNLNSVKHLNSIVHCLKKSHMRLSSNRLGSQLRMIKRCHILTEIRHANGIECFIREDKWKKIIYKMRDNFGVTYIGNQNLACQGYL